MDKKSIDGVILEIFAELERARTKHPRWPQDLIHGTTIVAEECGEMQQAALQATYEQGDVERVRAEAVQTAAMAIRLILTFSDSSPSTSYQVADGPTGMATVAYDSESQSSPIDSI